jgi:hypothetical protein
MYEESIPHYDPDPNHFTYGEPPLRKGRNNHRAEQLRNLSQSYYIFFVASLAPAPRQGYKDLSSPEIQEFQKYKMAKCVIGFFKVAGVYEVEMGEYDPISIHPVRTSYPQVEKSDPRIVENAHAKIPYQKFVCAVGEPNGRGTILLEEAVPLTNQVSPFPPNSLGQSIYGNAKFPRGHKWIENEKVELLLAQVRN